MTKRKKTKYIHEGQYVAEIDIELLEEEGSWSPYLRIDDAYKLYDASDTLKQGDFQLAAQYGRIYELTPVCLGIRRIWRSGRDSNPRPPA